MTYRSEEGDFAVRLHRTVSNSPRWRLPAAGLALALSGTLAACSEEPEVVQVDPVEPEEVAYGIDDADVLGWDGDGDGLLDRGEFAGLTQDSWAGWDADGNSILSAEEFREGWLEAGFAEPETAFNEFDDNGDGELVQAEFDENRLSERDSNEDGVLDKKEFAFYS